MSDVERSIYFYKVAMADGDEWKRADVLRGLKALRGDDQMMPLGNDNFAWVIVDRIPTGRQSGRLRFFRDRRANLPGFAHNFNPEELPIPAEAGLIEPTHIVLGSDGLIAAEYNHFAPRITTQFSALLRTKLNLNLTIGTYVQGSILEQLDRLSYIQLLEVSLVPTSQLEADLRNAGSIGAAAASLARAEGGRRVRLELRGDKRSGGWTEQVRSFVKGVIAAPGYEETTKALRVTGLDPVSGGVETIDLLKQKLTRRVDMEKATQRSKALNNPSVAVA
jgi:hypothetical protein